MVRKNLIFTLFGIFVIVFIPSVIAANGCNAADLECGSTPTDNCDVRVNTTFVFSNYSLAHGIDVCASNIVLDCNGAMLEFTQLLQPPPNVNATALPGTSTGILLDAKFNNTVMNCRVLSYLKGIELVNSDRNVISGNVVNSSIWYPSMFQTAKYPSAEQYGMYLVGSHNNTLIGNHVLKNEFYGMNIRYSNYNRLVQNNVSNNFHGVEMYNSNYNNLIGNSFTRDVSAIDVAGSSFNIFKHNKIYFSTSSGLFIYGSGGSDSNVLESNTICFNRQSGIGSAVDIVNGGSNSVGVSNTCDTVYIWNDVNVSGCTFSCSPILEVEGNPHLGNTINLNMFYRRHASVPYVLAFAFNTSPGIDLGDGRFVPLNDDLLFQATFDPLIAPAYGLLNSYGVMNNNGKATATLTIPNQTNLVGLTVYTAFGLINDSAPYPYNVINYSYAVPITILP